MINSKVSQVNACHASEDWLIACRWTAIMADRKRIIILDDDASMLTAVERALKVHGFDAEVFDTVEGLLAGAHFEDATCLVLDINLRGHCGIELRKKLAR